MGVEVSRVTCEFPGDFDEESRAMLAVILERARNDPEESVRVQAVAAVASWPNRPDVEQDLKTIAGTDTAQAVRYEAEKALFKRW